MLVGAFNPFTFKVMIDIYELLLFLVWGLFSVALFFILCFLPRDVSLTFVVKLVWWC